MLPATRTLFVAGDVMTGRGIDQILPHPGRSHLHEPWVRSAREYVELAERATGGIPRPVAFDYVWGDALSELDSLRPHVRLVNLETAVTASEDAWPHKGIHYRMHPANVPCLSRARIDCCTLANNHVLDWGYAGLAETLSALQAAGIRTAGAGRNAAEAAAPAIIPAGEGSRALVFAFGVQESGIPAEWAASEERAGVNLITDRSSRGIDEIARGISSHRRPGDLVIASIHWGGNWGYDVPLRDRELAHRLIDAAGVHLVHGHSAHHVKAIEVYRGKAILYGCGDLLDDYEGISGNESFRGDLGLLYFPTLDVERGELSRLVMIPTQLRHFRINRAQPPAAAWLARTLDREGVRFRTSVLSQPDGTLELRWA